jgi:hypothetical protein
MLTADTITDVQIRSLRDRAVQRRNHSLVQLCADALTLDNPRGTLSFGAALAARARCAEILNTRSAK